MKSQTLHLWRLANYQNNLLRNLSFFTFMAFLSTDLHFLDYIICGIFFSYGAIRQPSDYLNKSKTIARCTLGEGGGSNFRRTVSKRLMPTAGEKCSFTQNKTRTRVTKLSKANSGCYIPYGLAKKTTSSLKQFF